MLRADGNSRIGLGHVMRLLALAEILRPDFAEQLFLIREPDEALVQLLAALAEPPRPASRSWPLAAVAAVAVVLFVLAALVVAALR